MNDEQRISFPELSVKPESVYFVSCPKQGLEMEVVVLHRVGILEYFCPKQGQDFKSSAAPPPPASPGGRKTPRMAYGYSKDKAFKIRVILIYT